ncbi:hypothetical protein [Paenibacillus xylanilyticus]|uniref:DUF5666 domain-containing protein n=1 Tax=Paenibacillus xylanilyticus TaxID=248903 RepID=A0A7Y6EXV5_9BACL|nr:hypothetical protein [Paenibacillus xylanilyticus]NUU78129.1 hypothetical protein [Paenibacillus xylanilyticus]
MRKNNYFTSVLILLMGCSVLLAACDVITAQTITNTGSAQGMNGGGMMNGGPGMNGGTSRGGGTGMNGRTGSPSEMGGMMNADLTGRIISIDGNTVTVELLEFQDNSSQNSNNQGQQGGAPGRSMEMNETGVEMKLNLNADISITEGMAMGGRGSTSPNTNGALQMSDLKEGDVIMVWYKENTETVERMAVIQS